MFEPIESKNFNKFIRQHYKNFIIPKKDITLEDYCFPKKDFELQLNQLFPSEYINPKTPYNKLLIFHGIGVGKTCTAIKIAENFKGKRKIIIVTPASLVSNFRNEILSLCTGNTYISDKTRKLNKTSIEYQNAIKKAYDIIDSFYTIYSINKFVELMKEDININDSLLIIDEVHSIVSEKGIGYKLLDELINKSKNLKVVLMSGTPIFDKPNEIALTMNLLLENKMPINKEFIKTFYQKRHNNYEIINMPLFKNYIKGYISYVRGPPVATIPNSNINYVKCEMSSFQYKSLIKEPALEFYIKRRMVSNIAYPNGIRCIGGFKSMNKGAYENIQKYSTKLFHLLNNIEASQGPIFIYSNFRGYSGVIIITELLNFHGYLDYKTNGVGNKRYAIFSGKESKKFKDKIKSIFNQNNNSDGSQIKMIIGTSSAKQGITLLRVSEVHIYEPYFNYSLLEQVMGRAIRFCSHKDLPKEKQLVNVFIYLAVYKKFMTIDQVIMSLALEKYKLSSPFYKALKESAIDCFLFKNINEPGITCD